MNRQHFAATASEWLTAQHFIPDANTQLTFSANMLLQRNDKSLRQWHGVEAYRWTGFSFPVDEYRR